MQNVRYYVTRKHSVLLKRLIYNEGDERLLLRTASIISATSFIFGSYRGVCSSSVMALNLAYSKINSN